MKDLSGKRFGKLTVTEQRKKGTHSKKAKWKCVCDCGNFTWVTADKLQGGQISCGCEKGGDAKKNNKTILGITADTNISRAKTRAPTANSSTGVRCVYAGKNGYDCIITFQKKHYAKYSFPTIAEATKWRDKVYADVIDPQIMEIECESRRPAGTGTTAREKC